MAEPQRCTNWDGNSEGCNCRDCRDEAADICLDCGREHFECRCLVIEVDDEATECPFCDFGCDRCDPLVAGDGAP